MWQRMKAWCLGHVRTGNDVSSLHLVIIPKLSVSFGTRFMARTISISFALKERT